MILHLTKKDFVVETKRGSGPGGQHRNKTESAVTIKHPPSGGVGNSQDQRSQHANKKIAFKRLMESAKFKIWLNAEIFQTSQLRDSVTQHANIKLDPEDIKVEVMQDGRWVEERDKSWIG